MLVLIVVLQTTREARQKSPSNLKTIHQIVEGNRCIRTNSNELRATQWFNSSLRPPALDYRTPDRGNPTLRRKHMNIPPVPFPTCNTHTYICWCTPRQDRTGGRIRGSTDKSSSCGERSTQTRGCVCVCVCVCVRERGCERERRAR